MAYQFSLSDASVEAGVRRIATEEIDGALAALAAGGPLAERVHDARKHIKKLRALIRLVRPHFEGYATENRALRDAARSLSGLREAEAARATLADLTHEAGLSEGEVAAIAAPVEGRHGSEHDAKAMAKSLSACRSALKAIRKRAAKWKVAGDGFEALEDGLTGTFGRARRGMKRAMKHARMRALHDWRKRVKDHWYHARLLAPIWPEAMAPHVAAADTLGEALGDYNDLAELMADLAQGDGKARDRLVAEARERQEKLLDSTGHVARRLLADTPEALADRWRVWWEVWRG